MKRQCLFPLFLFWLLVSCTEGRREPSEAELSAFGTYVDSLDTALTGHWFNRMGVSEQADSLLAYLRRELPRNGLDTAAFFVPQIAEDLDIVYTLAFDSVGQSINEVLKRLDDNLSKAYVDYATGQRYGFIQPGKVFNRLQLEPDSSGYVHLFDYEVKVPDYSEAETALSSSDRMAFLRASEPTGHVYRALQTELLKTTDKQKRQTLAVNMERCRWQMKHPDETERMVLVNIPSQQLWAVCPDSVLNMRICCGAVATKTPLLNSAITHIQVNPEWIIPQKIVLSDVARHGGDSAYFARNNYFIVDRSIGDTLSPAEVSPDQLRSGRLRVGQRGGAGNSLGRIVFRFLNNFSVYLHDTNNRGAFQRDRRTLSHGCVRVEKPFELACFLQPEAEDWDKEKLRLSMDIPPETDRGREYLEEHQDAPRPLRLTSYLKVSPQVPVYIIYFTAYPSLETGTVDFWPDLYNYDAAIVKSFKPFIE